MGKTLEQFISEANTGYQPAIDAVQGQLDKLPGQLDETNAQINKQYAQQRARLNNQRNDAAYAASMNAAASGGGFGGQGAVANRKYYSQSFVPAVTQMNTNHSNDLSQARMNNENRKSELEMQLANMRGNAYQQALQAYYAAEEAEKNRALQRQQIAAQNAYNKYLMDAAEQQRQANQVKSWNFGNGYSLVQGANGQAYYVGPNGAITAGEFLEGTRGVGNKWDLWNDVWKNGISTNGVGSDTVESYGSMTPDFSSYYRNKYSYLY